MQIRLRSTGAVMFENELRQYLKENDGPSFDRLTDEVLEAIGADPVFEGPAATCSSVYEFSQYAGVEQSDDGKWYTKYVVGPIFQEIIGEDGNPVTVEVQQQAFRAQIDARAAESVRSERNQKLTKSDWTQMADSPLSGGQKSDWALYRQSLRDITSQPGFPHDVTWPTEP